MPDLNKREFAMLIILVLFTIALGIYPSIVLDSLHYVTQGLLHTFSLNVAHAADPYYVHDDQALQKMIYQKFTEFERLKLGEIPKVIESNPKPRVNDILG